MATTAPAVKKMTYAEFLDAVDEDTHAEWVNGEMILSSPVSRQHQAVSRFLVKSLDEFASARGLGTIFFESFQMKTGPDLPGREPDLIFVATENLHRVRQNFLDGPGDLVVEIISPESVGRDRGEKFVEYETGGVREYWLLDPIRKQAEFYQRGDDDGFFHPVLPDADAVYHSGVLPGLALRIAWLWQDPPPPLLDVLREWKVI